MDMEMLKTFERLLDEKLEPIRTDISNMKIEIDDIKEHIKRSLEDQNNNTGALKNTCLFKNIHFNEKHLGVDIKTIWSKAKQVIKNELTEVSYKTWIDPIIPVKLEGNTIFLETSSLFSKEIIDARYLKLIKTAIYYVTSQNYNVKIGVIELIKEEKNETLNKYQNQIFKSVLNSKYTFDSFVVGKSNYLAYQAAMNIAQNPKENIKLLYIYGKRGMGKTHLLHSIGNYILDNKPSINIIYFTIDDFTNQLIKSISTDRKNEFYNSFKNVDVMMIDDCQYLSGREATQDEFYKIISNLLHMDKQVIVSSDTLPEQILVQNERLSSVFEMDGVFKLNKLELDDRLSILKIKAQEKNIDIGDEILHLIAQNIDYNVRELISALNRLKSYMDITGTVIDKKLAMDIIGIH